MTEKFSTQLDWLGMYGDGIQSDGRSADALGTLADAAALSPGNDEVHFIWALLSNLIG